MTEFDAPPFLAIVGMAGRFPGMADVEQFWERISAGEISITRSDPDGDTGFISASGVVEGADQFDAGFFGFSLREALLLDPQHRVFMECSWEALEHAGCDTTRYFGTVGVFGGSGDTGHYSTLRSHRGRFPGVSAWQLRLASGSDFLTSRVAYKLGLSGPAVTVQTACSTSLVAVHMAAQALLAGECDLALAGGVTIRGADAELDDSGGDAPMTRDGWCLPFDAAATGTVASDGAGVVVLKRLEDAIAEGDHIHAVLRGSAINNDGSGKVGFTTPSVDGQAAAVAIAHLVADAEASTIGYVEAHGTGTPVGDPIEVRALSKAFGPHLPPGTCVLGSVKGNIGHTDAAAGVIGLIKAALVLENELIPPTARYRTPNPELGLEESPFTVTSAATAWPRPGRPVVRVSIRWASEAPTPMSSLRKPLRESPTRRVVPTNCSRCRPAAALLWPRLPGGWRIGLLSARRRWPMSPGPCRRAAENSPNGDSWWPPTVAMRGGRCVATSLDSS